ncbi:MAG: Ig-like domain-containing protein [archaeon]
MKRVNTIVFLVAIILSFGIVSSAPVVVLNSPQDNNVTFASSITFSCTVSDGINLTSVELHINGVSNGTNTSGMNNTAYFFERTFADGNYNWTCVGVNNESQNTNAGARGFVIDTSGPSYSNNSTNSTSPGQAIMHRLYFQDSNTLSGYIFSFDNGTGIFVNDSWQSFSGLASWSNVTKFVSSTNGSTIKWKIYANDSYNKLSVSTEYFYVLHDASSPSVFLSSPANEAGFSSLNITFSCSSVDITALLNVTLYGDWSDGWHANQTTSFSGFSNSTSFTKNMTATNKAYSWNCYSCDTLNNCGFASSNRTFLIDSSEPFVKLVNPLDDAEITTSPQIFKFNVTDNIGIKNCSLYIDDDLEDTKTSVNNATNISFSSISLPGSNSGLEYTWYVRCYDYGGNYDDSSEFIITVTDSEEDIVVNTLESDEEAYWTATYSPSSSEFSAGYTRELAKKSRLKVVIGGSNHYVGVVDLNSTTATINVSSTPQQTVFRVGDEKKFSVTESGYYDLYVKLNSLTSTKANISVKTINERIPLGEIGYIAPLSGTNETDLEDELSESEKAVAEFKAERIWIIIISVIMGLLLFAGMYLFKRRKDFGY